MITLSMPVFVALIVALIAIIGCGIWTGIRFTRKDADNASVSYPQLDIMVWLLAVVVLPLLALALTASIQLAKQKTAARAEKTAQTEALKAENDRKRTEQRERSRRAIRAAHQAEEEDRQAAVDESDWSDWGGIQKVLQSWMSPHAKVEYVVNALKHEEFSQKKSCSLSAITISQYNRLMRMLRCEGDCDILVSKLARALAICVDPLQPDAYQDFLEQQRAGKYDPENYVEKE